MGVLHSIADGDRTAQDAAEAEAEFQGASGAAHTDVVHGAVRLSGIAARSHHVAGVRDMDVLRSGDIFFVRQEAQRTAIRVLKQALNA